MPADLPSTKQPKPFVRRPLTWIIVAVLAAGGAWWAMKHGKENANGAASAGQSRPAGGWGGAGGGRRGDMMANRAQPVIVAPVEKADMPVHLEAIGTVTALNTVTVKTQVDGQLIRVLFREGEVVKAGQLLAEVDPRPYQVQLAQAEGQLAKDRAQLVNAKQDLERYKTLVAQESATQQQLDTQEALVRQLEGTVKSDQASIDSAKLQLTYSRITAPVGGRLGLRQVDPGNIVHSSDTNGIVVITQVQPINVVFSLPQRDITSLLQKPDGGAGLQVDALASDTKQMVARGKVLTVDNQIDTTTGTVKLKSIFPNQDNKLFPNQFVGVQLQLDVRHDAIVAPTAAVLRGAPGTFVYVANADKTVSVRPVKLGPSDNERTIIEDGLKPGEQVVIDGTDKLREGAKVEPVTREAAAKAMAVAPGARQSGHHAHSGANGEKSGNWSGRRPRDGQSAPAAPAN